MKLIIQIPCLNEEKTLGSTLDKLPRSVDGFDEVEWLIIDDGSTDNTVKVAKEHGVDHVVSHLHNMGLAKGFMTSLQACLDLGADVIVNTDADNQYCADDIPLLTRPILDKESDIVVGSRPISNIEHFSPIKKMLQKLGSGVVRYASGTKVADAPSGFRAISRNAAMQLNVFNNYTYTLETIIQAGQKNIAIKSVPIRVNEDLRPSRLVSSIPAYVRRSILTIVRVFAIYKPFRFFMTLAGILFSVGVLLGIRYIYFAMIGEGTGHTQSVILAGTLLGIGGHTALIAFIADIINANRKLLEEIKYMQHKLAQKNTDK
jgi:glycosyltransferase involved in cell wall biosynthesis